MTFSLLDALASHGKIRLVEDLRVGDFMYTLHHGDPTIGWPGCVDLALMVNDELRYEIWHCPPGNESYRILQFQPRALHTNEIFVALRDADQEKRRAMDKVEDTNAKVQKAADAAADETVSEISEHLAWAIKKDLG